MPSLFDWSTTAASNVTVDGLNIAEGCPAANVNNGMRSIMALVRASFATGLQTFLDGTAALPVANGGTGGTTAAAARTALGAAALGANTDITSLAAPSLGAATATTASGGTNTTQVATTAFVTSAVSTAVTGKAASGANSDITSLSGLTTALSVAQGGTGGTTAAAARSSLSAAASGANTDITALNQSTTIAASGTIASTSLGFRGVPLSGQTQGSAITLALSDAGKRVANTTGGWVIPANSSVAFPVDTVIVIHNDSASTQTLSITTDTLTLAGTATTGSRTVAANGLATITKITSTKWLVSGNVT